MTKFLTMGKLLDQYKLQFKRAFTYTNDVSITDETRNRNNASEFLRQVVATSPYYYRASDGGAFTLYAIGEYEYDGQTFPKIRIEFRQITNLNETLYQKPEDEYVFIDGGALMRFSNNANFVYQFLKNIYNILAKIGTDKSTDVAEEFLRACAIESDELTPEIIDELYDIPNVDISLAMMKKGYAFANINHFDKLLKSFQNELPGYYTDIHYQTAIVFLEDYSKHLAVDDYNQYSEFLQKVDYVSRNATFRSWRYSDDICQNLRRSFDLTLNNIRSKSLELAQNMEVTLPVEEVLDKNFEGENVSIKLELEDVSW